MEVSKVMSSHWYQGTVSTAPLVSSTMVKVLVDPMVDDFMAHGHSYCRLRYINDIEWYFNIWLSLLFYYCQLLLSSHIIYYNDKILLTRGGDFMVNITSTKTSREFDIVRNGVFLGDVVGIFGGIYIYIDKEVYPISNNDFWDINI